MGCCFYIFIDGGERLLTKIQNIKRSLDEAEKKARTRDFDNEIDVNTVNEIEEKANERGFGLYKKRVQNRANFTQVIYENLDVIVKSSYLSMNELGFLMSLQPLIEYQINAIMDKEKDTFMTVSAIAKYIGVSRVHASRIIQELLNKGILFEFVNVREIKKFNRNVSPRTLFVNPELFYAGDRNKIDATLATLVNEYDVLEDEGIKLRWKVYRKSGYTFGKLYNRRTYLEYKRNR